MATQYKLTQKLKDRIQKSRMPQYEIAQKAGLDRALLSIFMNKAYISKFYKNKIIKIGRLVGVSEKECLEIIKD